MEKEKIILFGTGEMAVYVLEIIERLKQFELVEVWDNDEKKHGMQYKNIGKIRKPRKQSEYSIIVTSEKYFQEIKEGLINNYGINESLIKPWEYCFYRIKEQIFQKYSRVEDKEIQDILMFLQKERLDVFNYPFKKKYQDIPIDIGYDAKRDMFYAFWHEKKMYLSRKYNSRAYAENYIRCMMIEQDKESPHYYREPQRYLKGNGIAIDAGAAEGLWALDVLDYVQKVILIEYDREWLEALRYTFEPYGDKIEIINKPLVEHGNRNGISISDIYQKEGNIACIKMDIEGMETGILQSEMELLSTDAVAHLLVCTYHKPNDEQEIENILCASGYRTQFSKGYIFFLFGEEILPELRRAVIEAEK